MTCGKPNHCAKWLLSTLLEILQHRDGVGSVRTDSDLSTLLEILLMIEFGARRYAEVSKLSTLLEILRV